MDKNLHETFEEKKSVTVRATVILRLTFNVTDHTQFYEFMQYMFPDPNTSTCSRMEWPFDRENPARLHQSKVWGPNETGHILSVETNTFVESMKQNVEFKKSICGVHEIA